MLQQTLSDAETCEVRMLRLVIIFRACRFHAGEYVYYNADVIFFIFFFSENDKQYILFIIHHCF